MRTKDSHAVYRHPDGRAVVIPPTRHHQARHTRLNPAASRYHARRVSRTASLTPS
ncbi:MAG: hypothetical protein M3460_13655 [Actinomycetota bacterium]|nr:hypothetical protein [Actinomycetota bacterium]